MRAVERAHRSVESVDARRPGRPVRNAATVALVYVVVAAAYIGLSGEIAAAISETEEELRLLELDKGVAFVVVTGALLFLLLRWQLVRAERATRQIERQRDALLQAELRETRALHAAILAHDLGNLVMTLDAALEERDLAPAEAGQDPQRVLDELRSLVGRLTATLGGRVPRACEAVELRELARSVERVAALHPDVAGHDVRIEPGSPVVVDGDVEQLRHMLLNLVINATQAVSSGGRVEIRLARLHDGAIVEVHDDGAGVPPDVAQQVFEPGFSTRDDGNGLGLYSVRLAAEAHGGGVTIDRSELGGACFRVVLRNGESRAGRPNAGDEAGHVQVAEPPPGRAAGA